MPSSSTKRLHAPRRSKPGSTIRLGLGAASVAVGAGASRSVPPCTAIRFTPLSTPCAVNVPAPVLASVVPPATVFSTHTPATASATGSPTGCWASTHHASPACSVPNVGIRPPCTRIAPPSSRKRGTPGEPSPGPTTSVPGPFFTTVPAPAKASGGVSSPSRTSISFAPPAATRTVSARRGRGTFTFVPSFADSSARPPCTDTTGRAAAFPAQGAGRLTSRAAAFSASRNVKSPSASRVGSTFPFASNTSTRRPSGMRNDKVRTAGA